MDLQKHRLTLLIGCMWLLSACTLNSFDALPTASFTPQPVTPVAENSIQIELSPEAVTQGDWQILTAGVERRLMPVEGSIAQLTVLRFDPNEVTFRAHYRPQDPLILRDWQSELVEAVAIINANFFTEANSVLGLLIADGAVYGQPYTDRGGWFGVQNGSPFVRSNINAPYQGETIEQAVQAFPMLVLNGQQAYTNTAPDRTTRRTAIGQDDQGRIILLVTSQGGMTLLNLSAFLAESDLNLVNAFNLDGGGSTMLYIGAGETPVFLPSFDPVPAILAVYPQ